MPSLDFEEIRCIVQRAKERGALIPPDPPRETNVRLKCVTPAVIRRLIPFFRRVPPKGAGRGPAMKALAREAGISDEMFREAFARWGLSQEAARAKRAIKVKK